MNTRQRKMIDQSEGREIALGSKHFCFYTPYIFKIVPRDEIELSYKSHEGAHGATFFLIFSRGRRYGALFFILQNSIRRNSFAKILAV